MGITKRFIPHSLYMKTGVIDAWINQVESSSPDSGVALFEESAGSETDREFVAIRGIDPTISIVTSDLSILATIGLAGLPIVPASGKAGITLFGRELPQGALPTALVTTDHITLTISDGVIIPTSLSASHNQAARLNLILHAILGTSQYSGATPFVFATGQAITSGAGQLANIYTTGPVKITDITVNLGIQVLKESSDGEVYPSVTGIIGRMPTVSFSTKDAELIASVGDGISVSAFAAYFRQVSANGQRVAPATATHVSIVGTAGMVTPVGMSLQHRQSAAGSFIYTPVKNTNILTISIASAIPTS